MVLLFYITYISVDLAHHEIFHAKVGKGSIKGYIFSEGIVFSISLSGIMSDRLQTCLFVLSILMRRWWTGL